MTSINSIKRNCRGFVTEIPKTINDFREFSFGPINRQVGEQVLYEMNMKTFYKRILIFDEIVEEIIIKQLKSVIICGECGMKCPPINSEDVCCMTCGCCEDEHHEK